MDKQRHTPSWLALAILAAIGTMGFVDRIIVNVLVEPLKREFALSDTQVSLLGFAFALLYIVVGILSARVLERSHRIRIIAFGTLIWSAATAACGLAASWVQLLASRMAVGVGEAIGLPGSQSVIADYFPPTRRGLAMSVLLLSPPLGALIGFVGGGWVTQHFDWRTTFLFAAIPGAILAILALVLIVEPPRGQFDKEHVSDAVPPLADVFRRLFGLSSARNMIFGSVLATTLGFGLNYFFMSLMIRRFDATIGEAGLYAGLIASLPAALSGLAAGWLGDRLGQKYPAAYALIPGVCLLLAGPAYAFAISRDSLALLLVLVGVSTMFQFSYVGITFATLQNLMHPRMRATTSAILNAIYGICGGLGPFAIGVLSDRFSVPDDAGYGLMLAMGGIALVYIPAALFYFLAARNIVKDSGKLAG
ncbi:MAG: spinster family MFS transporter [Sphingomonadaceae bacterium]